MKSILVFACGIVSLFLADFAPRGFADEIKLIVRGDDIGSSHTANVACIQAYREGIVRSVEVLVPAPWFNEAVKMLKENPGLDIGVHLDLTSEWELCKWGPITKGLSLMDQEGHFFPMTGPRTGFPPRSSFLEANAKIDEVEKELRAQIELAREKISNLSHLSCHMGTADSTPPLKALVLKLSQEYRLPLETPPEVRMAGGMGGSDATPQQREAILIKILENLQAGTWLLVEHPGLDTPEMRSLGHTGYWNVAADRAGVTYAFTSAAVKKVIEKRGIRLLSYGEFYKK